MSTGSSPCHEFPHFPRSAPERDRLSSGRGTQRGVLGPAGRLEEWSRTMNIVVSNVKGGVGKTTTTVYLAAAAVGRGWDPVTLIDADRQASSAEWLEESPIEGVDLVEAPSERTVARAMGGDEGLAVVDTPPGDERIVRAALERADAVVIPTRAGGVEYSRVVATLEMIGKRTPHGVVICAARLGTNDLDAAVAVVDRVRGPHLGDHPRAGGDRRRSRGEALPRGPRRLRTPCSRRRSASAPPEAQAPSGIPELAGPGRARRRRGRGGPRAAPRPGSARGSRPAPRRPRPRRGGPGAS